MDTFAVCTNCSRLSYDLHTCDKCGSSLSDDNMAHCYSSEPKRRCTDTQVNGKCGSTDSTDDSSVICTTALPSVSNCSTLGTDNAVRPQALYVNVNNQAFPVISVGAAPTLAGTLSLPRPVFTGSSGISTAAASLSDVNSSVSVAPPCSRQSSTSYQPVTCAQMSGGVNHQRLVVSTAPHINLPSYNLQPPPPPFAASVTRLPGIVSGALQSTVVPTPCTASGRPGALFRCLS